jgi:hypothetical protein
MGRLGKCGAGNISLLRARQVQAEDMKAVPSI